MSGVEVKKKRAERKAHKKKLLDKSNRWKRPNQQNVTWFEKIKTLRKKKRAPKEYTLETNFRLRKRVLKKTPNKRAKRAIRDIKRFVRKGWKVREVKIEHDVNKYIWSNGRRNPPRKIRLVITRKKRDDDDEKKRHDKFLVSVGMKHVSDWNDPDLRVKRGEEEEEEEKGGGEEAGEEEEIMEDEDGGEKEE